MIGRRLAVNGEGSFTKNEATKSNQIFCIEHTDFNSLCLIKNYLNLAAYAAKINERGQREYINKKNNKITLRKETFSLYISSSSP